MKRLAVVLMLVCVALASEATARGKRGAKKAAPAKASAATAGQALPTPPPPRGASGPAMVDSTTAAPASTASAAAAATTPRGPTRIDFDDRLIQGQSNKSGAVYLFDRKESALRSMVHLRTSFREEITKDVLD